MSYAGISVREALEKLNAPNNGWYLPQVQRQYVWGARHESEDYVCLLLDSLLQRYPIGGVVLWETDQKVPYRYFVQDYVPGHYARQVDEGRRGAAKALVYDGQQRLQTLYSVLRHRFNGRILHFDLLFDPAIAESDETGFLFRDAGAEADPRYLRMTEVSCLRCNEDEKVDLEDRALVAAADDKGLKLRVRRNLSALWDIFVDTNHKSIAYFSVKADTEKEVNEVFRRLNTGGIALTQLELVLGKIKAVQSDYEEKLWALSETITKKSGGIVFSSASILQFFYLLIKNTIRISEDRLDTADIPAFLDILENDSEPLVEVFSSYLNGLFSINHASIVPRWLAVLPIAAYLTELKRHGHEWRIRTWDESEVRLVHQYFLLSQLCDWNTQTMVNAFAREAMEAGRNNWSFPLDTIRQIAVEKNRTGELNEYQLLSQPWLSTKVLMPGRSYVFHDSKPQVDHIFPLKLDGQDEAYQEAVDVLWNFQPVSAEVNNYKRARHPREFFKAADGSKYFGAYDFVPATDSELWDAPLAFVAERRKHMLAALEGLYGLKVVKTGDEGI
ncbi:DUF262 domain-containing protein [Pseudomonas aeruginosa]|uniref:DUF262 domain-containing protein n=1 Tax=Pseudomonas aeruginosa TaxID=287 RepID=UPI000EB32B43|nr:DUF262 domain-containing protein [Pseudomonas aeruginosa]UWU63987.1 DUF262 domain-containing protein [Pseudomonas aeruginosa]HCE5838039.1 DUF262 domain-containing protein [Pseudomonas aeruginosa]HCE9265607.1 DUF262 domain-containing protein [Pseudomonas aeruginosa]HEP9234758.1 DUF262 domain-containing protein [Pseudomonas aeruginosa]